MRPPRIVLVQVRTHRTSLEQERECFVERCGLPLECFRFFNLVETPELEWRHVADADAVLIGGAGAFSVTQRHPFSEPIEALVRRLADDGRPMLGSCWGHQLLAETFGGKVIEDHERQELGTHRIELTEDGVADPLFAGLPRTFDAQLGHHDRVRDLGPGLVELARSELCPFQSIRLRDRPVYGTQFHSELDERRLRQRLDVYAHLYLKEPGEYDRIIGSLRPTPHADGLLRRFLELYVL